MAVLSQRELVEVAVQTTKGTAQGTLTAYTPIGIEPGTFSAEAGYEVLLDRGRRAVDAMDFGSYKGVTMAAITLTENVRIATVAGHTNKSGFRDIHGESPE